MTFPTGQNDHPLTPPWELEAIVELAGESALPEDDRYFDGMTVASLRAQRRPKPPSLEEQVKADIERERQEAADQELEACRQWLEINGAPRKLIDGLLVARCCPEPPSLKEEALEALLRLAGCSNTFASEDTADVATIRRALEKLP